MLDYLKILLVNADIERLKQKLDFYTLYKPNTDETEDNYIYEFHYCKLTIYPSKTVIFQGSVHKLWNSLNNIHHFNTKRMMKTGFNGNQFEYKDIIKVRRYLCDLFECRPSEMIFQNIEFGFNLITDFYPRLFTKGLLYHKSTPFEFKHYKNYGQCEHYQYLIKIYNKSYQYEMTVNNIRVEVKIIRAYILNNIGIRTFEDITPKTLKNALEHVKMVFSDVVYYDYTIRENELTEHNKNKLDKYKKDLYWTEDLNKKQRHQQRQNLNNIILHHSDNLKQNICQLLEQKRGLFNQYHINIYDARRELFNTLSIELSSPLFCEVVKNNLRLRKMAI